MDILISVFMASAIIAAGIALSVIVGLMAPIFCFVALTGMIWFVIKIVRHDDEADQN